MPELDGDRIAELLFFLDTDRLVGDLGLQPHQPAEAPRGAWAG